MNIKFYHFLQVSNNNRIDIMIKRNKNNEGKLISPLKEESRSLVKRAGLKIYKEKSRPSGVRGFESHLLHQ